MMSHPDPDDASMATYPSPSPSANDRPRVVIEDPHPGEPRNPLFSYLVGLGVIAGVLLLGLILFAVYHMTTSNALETSYANASAEVRAAKGNISNLQQRLNDAQEELSLYREGQANLTTSLVSAKQNYTDKINELSQCQNALLLAQGEIQRLQGLQASSCDTLTDEVKSDCNLALNRLFTNTTVVCGDVVDDMPNASGREVKNEVIDRVHIEDYTFPGVS